MKDETVGAIVIVVISVMMVFSTVQLKQNIIESDKGLWVTQGNMIHFEAGIQATFNMPGWYTDGDYRINDIKYPYGDTIHIDNRVILNQTINFDLDNFNEVVTLLRDNGASLECKQP